MRQTHMQMHVGAVEKRVALGQDDNAAARLQMRGDVRGRLLVERIDQSTVVGSIASDLGRHGIEQR